MKTALIFLLLSLLSPISLAEAPVTIRIGALALGTLQWELAVIKEEGLDQEQGLKIESQTLASPDAGRISLMGHSVDLIVTDWIWVAQQRRQGQDFTFSPFSLAHGALMVPADSTIRTLKDLRGKRLGVAGGGLDKNWRLLEAASLKTAGLNLEKEATISFGAPPLLSRSLQEGQLDALLTYWNHAAKLEALGYRQLLDGRSLQHLIGMTDDVPTLGYVFSQAWAKEHGSALKGFLKAASKARDRLCESDAVWAKVVSLTAESDPRVTASLRHHYCEGRVETFGQREEASAAKILDLVTPADGSAKNASKGLPSGTFFTP